MCRAACRTGQLQLALTLQQLGIQPSASARKGGPSFFLQLDVGCPLPVSIEPESNLSVTQVMFVLYLIL